MLLRMELAICEAASLQHLPLHLGQLLLLLCHSYMLLVILSVVYMCQMVRKF
jgi:hypothetical protein